MPLFFFGILGISSKSLIPPPISALSPPLIDVSTHSGMRMR
jgi:hypothetical protein